MSLVALIHWFCIILLRLQMSLTSNSSLFKLPLYSWHTWSASSVTPTHYPFFVGAGFIGCSVTGSHCEQTCIVLHPWVSFYRTFTITQEKYLHYPLALHHTTSCSYSLQQQQKYIDMSVVRPPLSCQNRGDGCWVTLALDNPQELVIRCCQSFPLSITTIQTSSFTTPVERKILLWPFFLCNCMGSCSTLLIDFLTRIGNLLSLFFFFCLYGQLVLKFWHIMFFNLLLFRHMYGRFQRLLQVLKW